jgi:hypothetical protein
MLDAIYLNGWGIVGVLVVLILISSHFYAFYRGHQRGLGQFRLSNPFGPAPIHPSPDAQMQRDYEAMKNGYRTVLHEKSMLERTVGNLIEENRLLEEKITASAKPVRKPRAKTGTASDGK